MVNHVLLNNVEHKDLKVVTRYAQDLGDNVSCVLTFPTEFGDVEKEYPILFQKVPDTGKYQSVLLLGIVNDENLFLSDEGNGWNARYVPGVMARGPFLIGYQRQEGDTGEQVTPVIHLDMDSLRLSETEGEAIFLDYGGNSPYLENIKAILKGLQDGMAISENMIAAFDEFGLIEPVSMEIQLKNDDIHRLQGYYTISEEKLAALDAQALYDLNQVGFLRMAFLIVSSMRNMQHLINLKNSRI